MFWLGILIPVTVLVVIYFSNSKMKKYLQNKWTELTVNSILAILSVSVGAYFALQSTIEMNHSDEIKNYLSMLNSCKNINERYLKKFKIITDSLNSQFVNYSELNRFIENINQPFLFEEVIKNSDLYRCSSIDFRNWLPDIISFLKETNWTISKENVELFNYNNHFLQFLKEILTNEEKFINQNLS